MIRFITIFALVAALFAAPMIALAEPSATEDLRETLDEVVAILSDKEIKADERSDRVVGMIRAKFDFVAMGRFILGPQWRKATEPQRKEFVGLYTSILENTYIDRIDAYTDEEVKYLTEKRRKDKAKVDTLVVSGDTEIPINYKLYVKGGVWYVYDVSIEGVSLVRNYQDTYKEIIRKEGIDGLLVKMTAKVKELERGGSK